MPEVGEDGVDRGTPRVEATPCAETAWHAPRSSVFVGGRLDSSYIAIMWADM